METSVSHTVIYMLDNNLLLIVKQFKADVSEMVDKMMNCDLDKKSRFPPEQKCIVGTSNLQSVFSPTKHGSKDELIHLLMSERTR